MIGIFKVRGKVRVKVRETNYEFWYTGEMYYNDNFKNKKNGE